jgi:hypothetical protein
MNQKKKRRINATPRPVSGRASQQIPSEDPGITSIVQVASKSSRGFDLQNSNTRGHKPHRPRNRSKKKKNNGKTKEEKIKKETVRKSQITSLPTLLPDSLSIIQPRGVPSRCIIRIDYLEG